MGNTKKTLSVEQLATEIRKIEKSNKAAPLKSSAIQAELRKKYTFAKDKWTKARNLIATSANAKKNPVKTKADDKTCAKKQSITGKKSSIPPNPNCKVKKEVLPDGGLLIEVSCTSSKPISSLFPQKIDDPVFCIDQFLNAWMDALSTLFEDANSTNKKANNANPKKTKTTKKH